MPNILTPTPRPFIYQSTPEMSPQCPPRLLSPIQLNSPKSIKRRHPLRRRRRVDSQLESAPHPFDQLPWISALDATPESLGICPCDIADLSQIPDPIPPSGPGPVRRRKPSLRSNPLATPLPSTTQFPAARSTLPFCDTPISRNRFIPARVLFHNLMPVYNDQPDSCTFIRPLSG